MYLVCLICLGCLIGLISTKASAQSSPLAGSEEWFRSTDRAIERGRQDSAAESQLRLTKVLYRVCLLIQGGAGGMPAWIDFPSLRKARRYSQALPQGAGLWVLPVVRVNVYDRIKVDPDPDYSKR